MRGLRWIGKILQMVVTALLAVLLACNLYILIAGTVLGIEHPNIFGFSTAVVVSGSMEPALSIDDMLVIRKGESYGTGDIITFQSGENLVTHRIVGETEEGFVTRGDANNTNDAEKVPPDQIVGKVVWHIPGIGAWIAWLKTPLGMTCLVLTGLLLIKLTSPPERRTVSEGDDNGRKK